jgi:phage terminase large subunit
MLDSISRIDASLRKLDRILPPVTQERSSVCDDEPWEDKVARWYDDPKLYAKERLGIDLWERQEETALAVAENEHTAVRSGHKTGKSNGAVCIGCWWAETRPRANVILTSTTDDQVKGILWAEFRKILERAPSAHEWPQLPLDPRIGVRVPHGQNKIFGRVSRTAEGTAGFSGENLFIIADEASGIPESIFEAMEGNLGGGGRILLLGNPTQTSGTFYEAFTRQRDIWTTIHVPSTETPNALSGDTIVPGLATKAWCEGRKKAWGEDDPRYQVRVLGNFPSESPFNVVSLQMVEDGRRRWEETDDEGNGLTLGVDVARFGDDSSTVYGTRNSRSRRLQKTRGFDTVAVAGITRESIRDNRRPGEPVRVNVDESGVGGGVVDLLNSWNREGLLGEHVAIVGVNVASVSSEPDEYVLLRDELWWKGRKFLQEGGAIEPNDELEADLLAPLYSFDSKGRIKVESKKDVKKRIQRSPDDGDGFLLSIYGNAKVAPMVPKRRPRTASRWASRANRRGY